MRRFCTQCGSPIEENARFCSSCGCKIERNETPINNKNTVNLTKEDEVVIQEKEEQTNTQEAFVFSNSQDNQSDNVNIVNQPFGFNQFEPDNTSNLGNATQFGTDSTSNLGNATQFGTDSTSNLGSGMQFGTDSTSNLGSGMQFGVDSTSNLGSDVQFGTDNNVENNVNINNNNTNNIAFGGAPQFGTDTTSNLGSVPQFGADNNVNNNNTNNIAFGGTPQFGTDTTSNLGSVPQFGADNNLDNNVSTTANTNTTNSVPFGSGMQFGVNNNVENNANINNNNTNNMNNIAFGGAPQFGTDTTNNFGNAPQFGTNNNAQAINNTETKKAKKGKGGLIVTVTVIVALVIALIVLVAKLFTGGGVSSLFGGTKGYEKPFEDICEALEKDSSNKIESAYLPSTWDVYSATPEDLLDVLSDAFYDCGEIEDVSYKVREANKLTGEDLEEVKDYIEYNYDEDSTIKEAYELTIKMTVKGENEKMTTTDTYVVVKLGGKWYITTMTR